jgi:type IV secretion system protein VirB1
MLLDLPTLLDLVPVCAPAVAPQTLLAVAKVESGFDPLAIGVNGAWPRRLSFSNTAAAAEAAHVLIAQGENVDLGLGQINVRNLAGLGLSIDAAFDPCRNLAASAHVLAADYQRAIPGAGAGQAALRTALSLYNTGRPDRGFANGYVARVMAAASRLKPAITTPTATRPAADLVATQPAGAAWDVFGSAGRSDRTSFVIHPVNGADQ